MVFSEPNGLALSEQSEPKGNKNAAPNGAAADSAKALSAKAEAATNLRWGNRT